MNKYPCNVQNRLQNIKILIHPRFPPVTKPISRANSACTYQHLVSFPPRNKYYRTLSSPWSRVPCNVSVTEYILKSCKDVYWYVHDTIWLWIRVLRFMRNSPVQVSHMMYDMISTYGEGQRSRQIHSTAFISDTSILVTGSD